jgi:signal peptidase II
MKVLDSIKVIPNFFYITFVKNEGAAFSILQNGRWFFIVLSILALIAILNYIRVDNKILKFEAFSYALVIGGIVGNLIDRIVHGSVIDYLAFYLFGLDAPVFNVADSAMVIGVIMIIYNLVIKGDKNEISKRR